MRAFDSVVVLGLSLFAAEVRAIAAGRPYAWTQGADGLPETGLELETWFGFDTPRDRSEGTEIDWWIGPVVGITDALEVALYGIFVQPAEGDHTGSTIGLGALRLQASYLLAPRGQWPLDVRLRLELENPVGTGHEDRRSPNVWLTAIAAFDAGPINFTANVGGLIEFESDALSPWLIFNGGASFDVIGGLRLGIEGFGQYIALEKLLENWVGPSLAFGVGRVWTTATLGFGIGSDSDRYRGRIVFALAF